MNEKELMTKRTIKVGMDKVAISTQEYPIIGTEALATCVGVLLYNDVDKRAIVAHVSGNSIDSIGPLTVELIEDNKLATTHWKYKIIPGIHGEHLGIKTRLEKFYSSLNAMFVPFDEKDIPTNAIESDNDKEPSLQFAFDASTGKFVTNKVVFGPDAFYVNNMCSLKVLSDNVGIYLSSEQIDLLSIIQCNSCEELIDFISNCEQISNMFSQKDFINHDLVSLKKSIFKSYQDTLISHDFIDENIMQSILNNSMLNVDNLREEYRGKVLDYTLQSCGLVATDIEILKKAYSRKSPETFSYIRDFIINRYPDCYEKIFKHSHRFVPMERNQLKNENLYDEFVILNKRLSDFDTILVDSLKFDNVVNQLYDDTEENKTNKFDFYYAKRDLDFAYKNKNHVRLHSLLTKGNAENLFLHLSKDEIIEMLKSYVKESIDFINDYNNCHKLSDGSSIINSVDLFNEIVSFDKMIYDENLGSWRSVAKDKNGNDIEDGQYKNIWEIRYGINIEDICNIFEYAKKNKPSGVSYLYNEPFLENTERRKKIIEVLKDIDISSPGLIDTLGTQMHITFKTSDSDIIQCFNDLKKLQQDGYKIQITEFDMSLDKDLALKTIGDNAKIDSSSIINYKFDRINSISSIINNSGVNLSGISYWTSIDAIDHNLERIKTNLINSGNIELAKQLKTIYGGLYIEKSIDMEQILQNRKSK